MKRFAVALTVVALLAPMLLALHPGVASATAPEASISIHQVAQLVTPPTGPVDVTVTYNCAPFSPSNTTGILGVAVNQFGKPSVLAGQLATCDDKSHTTSVEVPGTYIAGPANATASVTNEPPPAAP